MSKKPVEGTEPSALKKAGVPMASSVPGSSNTLISLKGLLMASAFAEFYSGIAFIFFPKIMSNPLQDPEFRGEWEGGPAAAAARSVLGCTHFSFGILSAMPLFRPKEKVTLPIVATLGIMHSLIFVPIALKWGFSITQIPALVCHAVLGSGFVSYAFRVAAEDGA